MQNFLDISSVVDSVRSNAGSAFKSVQRAAEESALKAAGLGEDEEALYRLNKHAQSYMRAQDALNTAAATLADDFSEAIEDFALREVARNLRDAGKATSAQQMTVLNRDLADTVRQACDADLYATRQQLLGKAFENLLGVNLECFRAASASVEEAHKSAQKVLKDSAAPKSLGRAAAPKAAAAAYAPPAAPVAPAPEKSAAHLQRRATAPAGGFDDLIGFGDMGGSTATKSAPVAKKSADLLDFDFGGPSGDTGTSFPRERAATHSAPVTHAASSPNMSFDFDFNAPAPTTPITPAAAAPTQSLGGLGGLTWTPKEEESESCIKARVEAWQQGKNLRTMLVTLHEVAPTSSGWVPVQLCQVVQPADVKSVYRKAVLAVHPDKLDQSKPGEKTLGHLVFQTLCDQWNVFRKE